MNDTTEALRMIGERLWQRTVARQPYRQLMNGMPVTHLPAETLADVEADASFAVSVLNELAALDVRALPYSDIVTLQFLQDQLARQTEAPGFWWTGFPVTPYAVSLVGLYGQMILAPFRFDSAEDSERFVGLAEDLGRVLRGLLDRLQAQATKGWRVPAPALPGVLATIRGLKAASAAWLTVAPERVAALPPRGRDQAVQGAARALEQAVVPSFDALLEYLSGDYSRAAPADVGLAQFPGGEEAYRSLVTYHLSFEIDPRRVHDVGLSEVARLADQMRRVRESVGFRGSESEFVDTLRASGRLHAKSAEDVEQTYRRHMARMEEALRSYVALTPKAPWAIARLAPAMEAGMSYGYYQPANRESPAGTYYYNGSGLETRSQLQAAALIFHELVPGHHLHFARQNENEDLPLIRRTAFDLTAFNEGWAEYASGLAGEMGLYDDPYDLYGRLIHERFVAQRLVVDTGLNLLGWTLDQARAYMAVNTLESETQVAAETLRYSTDIPAQSLAYRMGYLKFQELRSRAAARLGSSFNIRRFHEAILEQGALPLSVLERHIDHLSH